MVQLRRSSLPSLGLALVMGLALAWPDLAHRRFHELDDHSHDHVDDPGSTPLSPHIDDSESYPGSHPHLDLIATAPTKAGLHLGVLLSESAALSQPTLSTVCVPIAAADSIQPRGPPPGPPPSARAPPTA